MELLLPFVRDWLHLTVRWVHVAAAIAWVGTSFYFIALDQALRPPAEGEAARRGVRGEAWEIHAGGFYRIEKFRLAPLSLPESLRWFKWEAYLTWLSGFVLLVLLYYVDAETYLIDRRVADLTPVQAVALSLALLAVGWLAYDALARRFGDSRLLLPAISLLVVAVVWASGQLFGPRAAYIQAGAVLGTWMAANVFFVIIPGQRELVAARKAGRDPDLAYGARGEQRTLHNNYLTLPVLFAMISQHFPFTYGHSNGWLVLLALMAAGAAVQHFLNLRHQGRTVWGIPVAVLVGLAALATIGAPRPVGGETANGVEFADVRAIVVQRCVTCHSVRPTYPGIATAPKGVTFDTPEQLRSSAQTIYEQVVVTQLMPLGNATGMTREERELIARWIRSGAQVR